jgi:hypothetical protein
MERGNSMDGVRWLKGLLNGLVAWCLGFALYMVPAFVIAFGMTFDLGRQGQDPAAISAQIGRQIPIVYAGNRLLTVGLIVVTALLVLWRTLRLTADSRSAAALNGLLVGSVAAALTVLMFLGFGSFGWPSALAGIACVTAGVVGGASTGGKRTTKP